VRRPILTRNQAAFGLPFPLAEGSRWNFDNPLQHWSRCTLCVLCAGEFGDGVDGLFQRLGRADGARVARAAQ